MSHRFTFLVTVELERSSGKFASRDEMSDQILSEIEGADPGSLSGLGADGDSEYEVSSWEVEESA